MQLSSCMEKVYIDHTSQETILPDVSCCLVMTPFDAVITGTVDIVSFISGLSGDIFI